MRKIERLESINGKNYWCEEQLKEKVGKLISNKGALKTGEVKSIMLKALKTNRNDMRKYFDRKTKRIENCIGNIVSHQEIALIEYPQGFVIEKDKNGKATWYGWKDYLKN